MAVVNAAVNHGHANPRPVVASVPGCVDADGIIRDVIQSLHGMVDTYGKNLGVGLQSGQGVYRNRQSDALDHVEPVVQARAQALHSSLLRRLRNLLVLHDYLDGLIRPRALMGSRKCGREVRRELADRPPVTSPSLGEGSLRNDEEQQHAQALSPSCAVALASTRALWLQCLRHVLTLLWHKDCAKDSAYLVHGR